jgi:hypothetical protein
VGEGGRNDPTLLRIAASTTLPILSFSYLQKKKKKRKKEKKN